MERVRAPSAYSQMAGRSSSLQSPCHDVAFGGQQARAGRAAGAARADPAGGADAGGRLDQRRVAADVGDLRRLVEIDRDHVHAVGVADDLVARVADLAHAVGEALGQHAADHGAGPDLVGGADAEQPLDAAHRAVARPGMRVGVEEARLQHVAHRPDRRRLAGRPGLVGEVEDDADARAVGEPEVRAGAADALWFLVAFVTSPAVPACHTGAFPGIQPSASAGACGTLDPGNECRDDSLHRDGGDGSLTALSIWLSGNCGKGRA